LTTNNDIINYLKSNYNAELLSGNSYTLNVAWNDGRSQIVFVVVTDNIVNVSSPVSSIADVNLANLLAYVSDETLWGVRVIGDYVCLSDTGFTQSMDAIELDVPIQMIAEAADEIEKIVLNGLDAF
jgi:hypothetical protein